MDDSELQIQAYVQVPRDKNHHSYPYLSKRCKEADRRPSTPLHQLELVLPSCASAWNGHG